MNYQNSEEMLKCVDYIVEANSFEQTCLYTNNKDKVDWKDCTSGFGVYVGEVGDLYCVWISISVTQINNKWVLFWYPTSNVVDYEMCERYIRMRTCNRDTSQYLVDAQNFHQIIHSICK